MTAGELVVGQRFRFVWDAPTLGSCYCWRTARTPDEEEIRMHAYDNGYGDLEVIWASGCAHWSDGVWAKRREVELEPFADAMGRIEDDCG
jgi:hypothetical protein